LDTLLPPHWLDKPTPVKRSPFRPKPKPKRPATLVAKALGKSAKGYKRVPRNQEHMGLVASIGCLICRRPAQAHHVDILTPKGMGPKVSDYLTAPLCPDHHTGDDSAHGAGGERAFWRRHGIDIARWLLNHLGLWYPEPNEHVRAARASIEKQRAIERGEA
jgi:hypothetical protein